MEATVEVVQGDITRERVDAIVNAANTRLLGGGGVDGAVHRAAGQGLLAECCTIGGCPTGEARISGGYDLHASYVIHTVGPVWGGGMRGEDELLASCYRSSLALAEEHNVRTLAFPSISTGAYRFPVERAAEIAMTQIANHLDSAGSLGTVKMVCFDSHTRDIYVRALENVRDGSE